MVLVGTTAEVHTHTCNKIAYIYSLYKRAPSTDTCLQAIFTQSECINKSRKAIFV